MADSSAVKRAVIAKLLGDAPLTALMPNGVWTSVAPSGKTKVVIISQVEHHVNQMFQGRASEEFVFLVKAVALNTTGADTRAAAVRFDALLDWHTGAAPFTPTGYVLLKSNLVEIVDQVEPDDENKDNRWQHQGGNYEVVVSPL